LPSSPELLRAACAGDERAFGRLVRRLRPRLDALVSAQLRSTRVDPEDVLQESLIHAWHSMSSLRLKTPDGFVTWFGGVVRHRIYEAHFEGRERQRPRRSTAFPWLLMASTGPEHLDVREGPAAARGARDGLRSPMGGEVDDLLPEQRVAWILRELFHSRWETVAVLLARSGREAARQLHWRARASLTRHAGAALATGEQGTAP
jgi:DNA-directed RNA polymerase specialized sigma24 family protein